MRMGIGVCEETGALNRAEGGGGGGGGGGLRGDGEYKEGRRGEGEFSKVSW